MKIKKIKINNYGNLENKEINFNNKINIIYGKNESGKSTLLNYIKNILYGISRNKNGKNISDYDRYKPWGKEEFSGKLQYELDDGKEFEIFRDFNKKKPKIFNGELEDISKEFNVDKKDGIQFFYEQTGVDETMFTSTVLSMQEEVKLDRQEQNILIQKLANLAGTGDDNLSYKKLIDKLNKMQIEEVGTDRSQGRPINITKDQLKNVEIVLKELKGYQKDKQNNQNNRDEYNDKIELLRTKIDALKEVNITRLCLQEEQNKIDIKEKYKNEKNKKVDELILEERNLTRKKLQEKEINKKNNSKKYIIILFFILIINIILFIFNNVLLKNKILNIINYFFIPIYLIIIFIIEKNKNKKLKNKINIQNEKINNEILLIEKQMELLKKEIKQEEEEIKIEQMELDNKFDAEMKKIKEKYRNKIDLNYLLEKVEKNNINYELNNLENELSENVFKLQRINLEEDGISKKLETMSELQEEYELLKQKLSDLEKRNDEINLTKEFITKAYINMKNNVTPKFTENLSKNISEISDGKYDKVGVNDDKGLIIENEQGEYISAEQLSVGTIDQLYLSLRLSMIDELSNERMPIILDEAFAYYDDTRLKNILKFLSNNLKDHQVIIFTCTNREKQIFDELNKTYNLVEL